MSVAVLLAAVAMPFGPAQAAPGPRAFPLGESFGGAVADGALFYRSRRGRRGVIRRLDLDSGAKTVVYTAPDRRTHISRLQAGGDRVAFELVSDRMRLFGMRADGTGVEELVRARDFERRDCGSLVRLLDVSSSAEVLYEHTVIPCWSHRGNRRILANGSDSRTRKLDRRPTGKVYIPSGPPFRKLAGDQFLTWGNRTVRVVDLASGRVRRFRPPDRRTRFAEPDVAADGRLLLHYFRFMGRGRPPRETIRLVGASGAARVVHRTRRAFGQARFCGERPVLSTSTRRRRLRLTVLDPPTEVFAGVLARADLDSSCDARHFVHMTIGAKHGERAYVHTLPG
jgi:hypothetical protein